MAGIASAAGSVLGGIFGGEGAKKGADEQSEAYQRAIDEQRYQFDTTQANLAPFISGGRTALNRELNLLGVNGAQDQAQAIGFLKDSPQFTSLYHTGADTILQNAAATGGLRGGNTNNSLAQFGSGLLNSVIQQQLDRYGGLVNTGVGSAQQLGQIGQANANSISQLLGQQGQANATAAAAPYAILGSTLNGIGGAFGSGAFGLGGGGGYGNAPLNVLNTPTIGLQGGIAPLSFPDIAF